jgi:hypothetical protein
MIGIMLCGHNVYNDEHLLVVQTRPTYLEYMSYKASDYGKRLIPMHFLRFSSDVKILVCYINYGIDKSANFAYIEPHIYQ